MRFILAFVLTLLICESSPAQYRYQYNNQHYGYYNHSYYNQNHSYYNQNYGYCYYEASWHDGRYYKSGYYAQSGGRWILQGYGPYDGEAGAPAPAPAPTGKGGPTSDEAVRPKEKLTPEEVAKLKELLKKLDP